jgi:hypothetical protein
MKRIYELSVEISDHQGDRRYLVTLSDKQRGVILSHLASRLNVCMTAVTGRVIADDGGGE